MKEGGVFITSGIISGREDEVRAALIENGFEVVSEKQENDWISIVCR